MLMLMLMLVLTACSRRLSQFFFTDGARVTQFLDRSGLNQIKSRWLGHRDVGRERACVRVPSQPV